MSDGAALDVRELLRLMCEQQATLSKLQQLVFEYALSETRPDLVTGSTPVVPAVNEPGLRNVLATVTSPVPEAVAPTYQDDVSSTEQTTGAAPPVPIAPEAYVGRHPLPKPARHRLRKRPSAPARSADSPFRRNTADASRRCAT